MDPFGETCLGKNIIFCEKTITRMNGIGLALDCCFKDPLMVEIGVLRCCFTNVEGIIGKPHMQSITIGF